MQSSSINDVVKTLLLSSPPGQFDETLSNIQFIVSPNDDNNNSMLLSNEFIQEVKEEYNHQTGRSILSMTTNTTATNNNDEFETNLHTSFQTYIQNHYSSKGVESNYNIIYKPNESSYDIHVYAERIKLPQYNTGSWYAKYVIKRLIDSNDGSNSKMIISGVVDIHTHAFENGNVQLQSKTTFPPQTIETKSSTSSSLSALAEQIISHVQKWDEEYIIQPLKHVYNDMSNDILKKMRRVMPVTRRKFDWNVEGHRFMNILHQQQK